MTTEVAVPVFTLVIPGVPVPKARARTVNGHTYTPAATVEAEERIGWLAKDAWRGKELLG